MKLEITALDRIEHPSVDSAGLVTVLDGAWAEAATDYAAEWTAKRLAGRRGPVGVQKYLNSVLDRRFSEASWGAYQATYTQDQIWLRVTFRHQMSAGANILEALKAVVRYEYRIAIIAAATRDFLELISPADAPSLTSYEKLVAELDDLEGVINAPIAVASLTPSSVPSGPAMDALLDPGRRRR